MGILQRMRTAGLLLALFALTFKAVLPPGFMIDTGDSRIAIAHCNGGQTFLDLDRRNHAGGQTPAGDTAGQHCPFALMDAPTLAGAFVAERTPPLTFGIDSAAPNRTAIGVQEATGPPLPARGPPTQA